MRGVVSAWCMRVSICVCVYLCVFVFLCVLVRRVGSHLRASRSLSCPLNIGLETRAKRTAGKMMPT